MVPRFLSPVMGIRSPRWVVYSTEYSVELDTNGHRGFLVDCLYDWQSVLAPARTVCRVPGGLRCNIERCWLGKEVLVDGGGAGGAGIILLYMFAAHHLLA